MDPVWSDSPSTGPSTEAAIADETHAAAGDPPSGQNDVTRVGDATRSPGSTPVPRGGTDRQGPISSPPSASDPTMIQRASSDVGLEGAVLSGRYQLRRHLAQGGMAEVWEGYDTRLDRPVAVKMLHPNLAEDPGFLIRFQREAIAAAQLSHPNIVAVYDAGAESSSGPDQPGAPQAYIVMELIRGQPLRALMSRGMRIDKAVDVAIQVAHGLSHAHKQGLVHRDIKPANILVQADGRVKVADFGIAKALGRMDSKVGADPSGLDLRAANGPLVHGEDLTQMGAILGTAKYVSPEQVTGQPVDARSDLYSLGVVLYEMVSGRAPYVGKSDLATATMHASGGALRARQIRPGVPKALDDVIMRTMAVLPQDRYANADALADALGAIDLQPDDAVRGVARTGADLTPPGGVGLPGRDPTRVQSGEARRRGGPSKRPPLLLRLALTVLVGAGVGAMAGWIFSSPGSTATVPIVDVGSFDPYGTGPAGENDAQLSKIHDGDPSSTWSSESYNSGLRKAGVGIVVELRDIVALRSLRVTTGNRGWTAAVFVSPVPQAELAGWGAPVSEINAVGANATFDLRRKQGRFVLLWITDLGPNRQARIAEISVRGV